MKTQKQIEQRISEIDDIITEAEIKGTSRHINTFSDLRKYKTQMETLRWVLKEDK